MKHKFIQTRHLSIYSTAPSNIAHTSSAYQSKRTSRPLSSQRSGQMFSIQSSAQRTSPCPPCAPAKDYAPSSV